MTNNEKLDIDELCNVDRQFGMIAGKIGGILVVDPSFAKSRTTLNCLRDAGYLNIDVENDLKKLPLYFKNKDEFILVILDADVEDNLTFKLYLALKQAQTILPPVVFLKSEVNDKIVDIFKKGGALGCLKKPLKIEELEKLLPNASEPIENTDSRIEKKDLAGLNLIRLHGDINQELVSEFSGYLSKAQADLEKRCILDFSKAVKFDSSIEGVLKSSADDFKKSDTKMGVYDPKNKLTKFNLENIEGLEFI